MKQMLFLLHMKWTVSTVTLLMILSACGGSVATPGIVEAVSIQYGDVGNAGGQTVYGKNVTNVIVNPGNNRFDNGVVIAHELMHVVGFVKHIVGECLFSENPYVVEGRPCPAEINMIRSITRTYTVTVLDIELFDPTVWAASMWNEAAGRDVFVIEAAN